VELVEWLGSETFAYVDVLHGAASGPCTVVAQLSPKSRIGEGEELELAVNPRALHFFHPETGLRMTADPPIRGAASG
jgi:ABC-type sugar transport system ATPase subunit